MPRKKSGIAMIVIDPSSVARSTASVALESAIHLYRSSPGRGMDREYTGSLFRLPVEQTRLVPMVVDTGTLAHELRETIGRLVRRLRAEPGTLPVPQGTVLARLDREGSAGASDLAAAERMRPQSMAQIVRELESAGLISRRSDPDDGRHTLRAALSLLRRLADS